MMHLETQYILVKVLLEMDMHDLNQIMKKHQQTQIKECFRKYQACALQNCQGYDNFFLKENV